MKCICCDNKINPIYNEDKTEEKLVFEEEHRHTRKSCHIVNAGNRTWENGLVDIVSAGYGSIHDGDEFVVAICDSCLQTKMNIGTIAYLDNNICRNKAVQEARENYREIWKQNNK